MKTATVTLLATLGLFAPGDKKPVANVGDTPEHTFLDELVNGRGTKNLAALKGRPVLVEFWGTY